MGSKKALSKTIRVSPDGDGDFTTVQQAVDSVPSRNDAWIRISLKIAVYNEKVTIPKDKPFILLEGEGTEQPVIQAGLLGGSGHEHASFAGLAENFVAKNISFKHTYKISPGEDLKWTPAAHVGADKMAFFNCSFYGQMDTLNDANGHHYFKSCYIEGLVDLIWGSGKSIYEDCNIFIRSSISPALAGYITAQGRDSATEDSGFVFKGGSVSAQGPGSYYLGRVYRPYSTVLFYKTDVSKDVAPEGWWIWGSHRHEKTLEFSEEECTGAGADMSLRRVSWEKKLSPDEVELLTDPATSIDKDGWLEALP